MNNYIMMYIDDNYIVRGIRPLRECDEHCLSNRNNIILTTYKYQELFQDKVGIGDILNENLVCKLHEISPSYVRYYYADKVEQLRSMLKLSEAKIESVKEVLKYVSSESYGDIDTCEIGYAEGKTLPPHIWSQLIRDMLGGEINE